jgi:HK97 family phage portal protein
MNIIQSALSFFNRDKVKRIHNKFNQAQFWGAIGEANNDDQNIEKYVDSGYNINADVYSIVEQISNKLISIPYYIKEVKDVGTNTKMNRLLKSANYMPNLPQKLKAAQMETKALSYGEFEMPFAKPNPNQEWNEFFKLTETFFKLTGSFFWYKLAPKDGAQAGEPIQLYCLPAHKMEIELKRDADMLSIENPIDYYKLADGNVSVKFQTDEIIHVGVSNPNFGLSGEHLYGHSPLRAVWKSILASNKGLDLNIEMLKNAGVFGFIHSKGSNFNVEQGKAIKDRLLEAKSSKAELSNIMGASTDMGFTRISLTPEELQSFAFLKYNQKQICNALGWSDTLLNNDDGGKHDKQELELRRVLTNTIIPDAKIIEHAFNTQVLANIKSYKGKCLIFDYKELAEMQEDIEVMSKWCGDLVDKGIMNRLTAQRMMRLPESEDPLMEMYTVKDDIMSLEDAILPTDELTL